MPSTKRTEAQMPPCPPLFPALPEEGVKEHAEKLMHPDPESESFRRLDSNPTEICCRCRSPQTFQPQKEGTASPGLPFPRLHLRGVEAGDLLLGRCQRIRKRRHKHLPYRWALPVLALFSLRVWLGGCVLSEAILAAGFQDVAVSPMLR